MKKIVKQWVVLNGELFGGHKGRNGEWKALTKPTVTYEEVAGKLRLQVVSTFLEELVGVEESVRVWRPHFFENREYPVVVRFGTFLGARVSAEEHLYNEDRVVSHEVELGLLLKREGDRKRESEEVAISNQIDRELPHKLSIDSLVPERVYLFRSMFDRIHYRPVSYVIEILRVLFFDHIENNILPNYELAKVVRYFHKENSVWYKIEVLSKPTEGRTQDEQYEKLIEELFAVYEKGRLAKRAVYQGGLK